MSEAKNYVLGIDLGANSVGWAAIEFNAQRPVGILAAGVRVFEAGVEGALERGREESRAVQRRIARLQRRQTDRRRRRIARVYRELAQSGLLPAAATLRERVAAVQSLDRELSLRHNDHHRLLYILRRRALDERLEPHEVGRALLHLGQRRGFQSNRKHRKSNDDERGKVKAGIAQLRIEMEAAGARTLGEYLSQLDPHQTRIRGRYTLRQMYKDEFARIWEAQAPHHPALMTGDARQRVFDAIFDQRPLREQDDLIGECEAISGEKRAPKWHPLSQRFRMLQQLNDLRIVDAGGGERPLDEQERAIVIERLSAGDLPLKEFRKLLGLSRGIDVNFDRGGKEALIGDRTTEKMRKAFLHRWDLMSAQEKLEAITDLTGKMTDEELRNKAESRWQLNGVQADLYVETTLEDKYIGFSLKALEAMLPWMEQGLSTTEAREKAFGKEALYRTEIKPNLPPVRDQLREIRNPAVVRSLTELRRVVNELLRRFGKPAEIHLELARDLKASRDEREKRWQRVDRQRKLREEAFKKAEKHVSKPSRTDVDKWLLFEECGGICPYSGRAINETALFHSGEVQIEHIIPFSRSLDDSFANLTLCYVSENARKGNRTPLEAYAGSDEWEEILQRVRRFQGNFARAKLRRFQMKPEEVAKLLDDFSSRQLNDTRYASKLAARYVSCLYGGLSDECGNLRVFATAGQVTAKLRRLWQIEGILSDSGAKTRDDHRHHAIDAITVALTSPGIVKKLADENARAAERGQSRLRSFEEPWPGFAPEVKEKINQIVVSWRCDRRVSGAMHDQNPVGEIQHRENGHKTGVRRKPVHQLSSGELNAIIDRRVRELVQSKLKGCGNDIQRLEQDPPRMESGVPIKKVRIEIKDSSRRVISAGIRARQVIGGDYHHFEVVRRSSNGRRRGLAVIPVSMQEAMERVRSKRPVVQREHGDNAELVNSVFKRDTFEIEQDGAKRIVVIQALEAPSTIGFKSANDGRPYSNKHKNRERVAANVFFGELKARKVTVSPTGLVLPCNESPAARLR
jgi:CRISPR-associated endonuclease Csn1